MPNVRDHRHLPVARLLRGEERTQVGGVTRVAIRWIALFAYFFIVSYRLRLALVIYEISDTLPGLVPQMQTPLHKMY
jgi:hypothetical protein